MSPQRDPSATEPHLVILPEAHLDYAASLVVAYGLCTALPVALIAVALVRWTVERVRAARARAVQEGRAPLRPGPVVLRGPVEYASGSSSAVRVEIQQLARQYTYKGHPKHEWNETARRTIARPFYVRDERGQRVRVEPPADVLLIDDLDEWRRTSPVERVRSAAVTEGEEVWVIGQLASGPDPQAESGYRGGAVGPVVRPPAHGPMLVASQPPAHRFRDRAFVHGVWTIVFAIVLVVFQLVLLFHNVRMIWGETTVGTVDGTPAWVTKTSKGRTVHHWGVRVQVPGRLPFQEEVERVDWDRVSQGTRLAVVHVPGRGGYPILGDRPTVHAALIVASLLAHGLLFGAYAWHRSAARPWYERPVNDRRDGPLPAMGAPEVPEEA